MHWWMMSADKSCVVNMREANAFRVCEHPYEHKWTLTPDGLKTNPVQHPFKSTWALQVDVLDNSYTLGEYKTFREAHEEMMRIVRDMNSKEREEA